MEETAPMITSTGEAIQQTGGGMNGTPAIVIVVLYRDGGRVYHPLAGLSGFIKRKPGAGGQVYRDEPQLPGDPKETNYIPRSIQTFIGAPGDLGNFTPV